MKHLLFLIFLPVLLGAACEKQQPEPGTGGDGSAAEAPRRDGAQAGARSMKYWQITSLPPEDKQRLLSGLSDEEREFVLIAERTFVSDSTGLARMTLQEIVNIGRDMKASLDPDFPEQGLGMNLPKLRKHYEGKNYTFQKLDPVGGKEQYFGTSSGFPKTDLQIVGDSLDVYLATFSADFLRSEARMATARNEIVGFAELIDPASVSWTRRALDEVSGEQIRDTMIGNRRYSFISGAVLQLKIEAK